MQYPRAGRPHTLRKAIGRRSDPDDSDRAGMPPKKSSGMKGGAGQGQLFTSASALTRQVFQISEKSARVPRIF